MTNRKSLRIYLRIAVVIQLLLVSQVSDGQTLAVKTNLISDVLLVPSLGAEAVVYDRWSISLSGSYMPLKQSLNYYWRTFSVQPEGRYWLTVPLAGPFVGLGYQFRGYNLGGLPFSHLKDSRSQGRMQGVGASFGWHWIISTRWSLEASMLFGWSHLNYDHYADPRSDVVVSRWRANYIGPLDLALNLVYIIK